MALKASYKKRILQFRLPAGTSKGVLTFKDTYYLVLYENGSYGLGECSTIPGLSLDYSDEYEKHLITLCELINNEVPEMEGFLSTMPSLRFGLEMALLDLRKGGQRILFPGTFTNGKVGIPINGLIWMGNTSYMLEQIKAKVEEGYTCLKLKIGALNFENELEILQKIRSEFSVLDMEIRLDANGAFSVKEALEKLNRLSEYSIHSIEQPIKAGLYDEMGQICLHSPIPVALDEELTGNFTQGDKHALLYKLRPSFIILKPSMLGGFRESEEWIEIAGRLKINWWVTSALESNIGLNAIAQWVHTFKPQSVQGLGTGGLYTNNIHSPLFIANTCLNFNPETKWQLHEIIHH